MLAYKQDRKKRYTEKVFSKITEDQKTWLERRSDRTNIPVSELIRNAIQAAIDEAKNPSGRAESDDIRTCLELLQAMRSESLSAFSCLGADVRPLSSEAEATAAVDLAKFRERMARNADLLRALSND